MSEFKTAPASWWVVASREFRQLVHNRAYIITTIIGLLLLIGLSFVPALIDYLASRDAADPVEVVVITGPEWQPEAGEPRALVQELTQALGSIPAAFRPSWHFVSPAESQESAVRSLPPGADWARTQAQLDPLVKEGRIDAYIWIGKEEGSLKVRFTRKEVSNTEIGFVRAVVEPVAALYRAREAGLSPEQIATISVPTLVEGRDVSPRFSDRAQVFSEILTYFLLIALYMAAILYGNMIAMGVVQEKSSRVVEMLVSAARPIHILIGKVLGIGLAGLLQFGIWTAGGLVITLSSGQLQRLLPLENGASLLAAIPLPILLYFTLFFLLGYFLYAVLNAGFASMASRVEEMNAVMFPTITLIIIAYFLAFSSFTRSDNLLAVIGSLIPFFTPMVMFTRVILTPVPAWQVALSIVLTLLTILLAARLYHANILRFRRVSWKEAWRALRNGEKLPGV
ncbi:MAG: ABC transporter permease [Limnochordales bacterium]|nr:ABC transporter permease [Limnochordales bacterium]